MTRSKLDPLGPTARLVLREIRHATQRGRWIKIQHIADALRVSENSIRRALDKLRRRRIIVRTEPHTSRGTLYEIAAPPLVLASAWTIPPFAPRTELDTHAQGGSEKICLSSEQTNQQAGAWHGPRFAHFVRSLGPVSAARLPIALPRPSLETPPIKGNAEHKAKEKSGNTRLNHDIHGEQQNNRTEQKNQETGRADHSLTQ